MEGAIMPTRNTKLYNQENLNKIKKLRSQGYMLHEIDVYLEWPRGTSSYHLRKVARAMEKVKNINYPLSRSRIEKYSPISKGIAISVAEEKFPSQRATQMSIPRKEWESLTIVVKKVGEVVSTETNRSNAAAQVENIRGILLGHDFLTRRK